MSNFRRGVSGLLLVCFLTGAGALFGMGRGHAATGELERNPGVSGPYRTDGENFSSGKVIALNYDGASRGKRKIDNMPLRILLGFLVPGLPQYLDGKRRSYGYFVLEGASIAGLVYLNSRGNSHKEQYYNLSALARQNFVYPGLRNNPTELTDPLLEGYGEYYEDLLKWPGSGDYDNDPSLEGIQPETNSRTYNGHQWDIARINNYSLSNGGLPAPADPEEQASALEAYKKAVYTSTLNWDWTGIEAEQERYHDLFGKSENAFRRRSSFVTVLLANHLVSGLDILVTEKLNRTKRFREARLEIHLELRQPRSAPLAGVFPVVNFLHRF